MASCGVQTFPESLRASGEGAGFGLEGLGEPFDAQHTWLIFPGEAKGGGGKNSLLSVPGGQE